MAKQITEHKIVEKVKNFVQKESKKTNSHYGYEPFLYHFPLVVSYAQILAKELNADSEVVTLAAGFMILALSWKEEKTIT